MIKNMIKKIIWGYKASSEEYIQHLRSVGFSIGDDVTIYAPTKTFIDEQYPWMVSIGSHVRITEGVKILTHDYSWSVLKAADNDDKGIILGASGEVNIGNNVFIGMNSIITRNVRIEDNVIIGAGSIVTKDCQKNSIYAGNPAKYIMSLEDFERKRKELQFFEAKKLVKNYYKRYGFYPEEDIFDEYFMLFTRTSNLNSRFQKKIELCNNPKDTLNFMNLHEPMFNNFNCMEYLYVRSERSNRKWKIIAF